MQTLHPNNFCSAKVKRARKNEATDKVAPDGATADIKLERKPESKKTNEELLAELVGSVSAPVSGFVNVLQGNIKGLLNVLSKIHSVK